MSNMSYCRFRNTLLDMQDCEENWEDDDMSNEEERARNQLLKVCQSIVDDYGKQLHNQARRSVSGKGALCLR